MPIQTNCPQCQASYRLPDTQKGKRVRRKKCTAVFTAGDTPDVPVLQEATTDELRPKRPSKLDSAVEELPVFDEVTTAPRARPTPVPARCSGHGDRPYRDDDDRDRDRYDEPPLQKSSNLPLILGGVGAAVVLIGLGIGAVVMFALPVTDVAQPGGATGGPVVGGNGGGPIIIRGGNGGNNEPAAPRDVDTALAYVKGNDSKRRKRGLEYLKTATVDPSKREQLDRALEPLIDDRAYKRDVVEVVLRWGGKHQMAALEEQMEDAFKWKDAMTVLAKMDDDKAAELIAEHLGKTFHEEEAARVLKKMGKRAEKPAVKYLHHRLVREHVKPLVKEWKTSDEVLAEQAVEDLAAKDREVKDAAAETLGECKVVESLQAKVSKALAEHMKEDWFGTRKKTAKALQKWATVDSLATVHTYLTDREPEVRESTFFTIARLKDDSSIPFLVLRIGSEDKVAAAKVLVTYGDKAEKSVQVLLNSKDGDIRLAAIQLLAVIGTKDSVPLLTKLAKLDAKNKAACNQAIKVIEARDKKDTDGKEKDKKEK